MTRSIELLLEDILQSISRLQRYTSGISFDEFAEDTQVQDAVIRRIEIIGEAVKGIPEDFRALHPDIPWRDIAGARDLMIHQYHRVDLELAWDMVMQDVPKLAAQIERIRSELYK